MEFRIANERDIDAVAALYDAACDALIEGEDSPGWEKGVYPVRQDAVQALAAGELFVVEEQGEIAGTVVLREEQEPAVRSAPWQLPLAEEEQLTVYTFAVHPAHKHRGVGHAMLDGAAAWAKGEGKKGAAAGCPSHQYPGDQAVRKLRLSFYRYRGPGVFLLWARVV